MLDLEGALSIKSLKSDSHLPKKFAIIASIIGLQKWKMLFILFYFKNHAENEAGRLVEDLILLFKKALLKVKASSLQLDFTIFR